MHRTLPSSRNRRAAAVAKAIANDTALIRRTTALGLAACGLVALIGAIGIFG